tara:strand:+ start:27 stop:449 length:423 start_codon:yes stop_codon:yes gene_type:complete
MSSKEAEVEYTLRTLKFGDDEELTEKKYTDSMDFVADKKTAEREQVDNNLYELVECVWVDADTGIEIRSETRDLNKCECCDDMTLSIFETIEDKPHNQYTAYNECYRCELKFCNQCIFSKRYDVDVCFCEECYNELTEEA